LELYNLNEDPGERNDVSASHADIVERLQRIGEEARRELGDSLTDTRGRGNRPPGRAGEKRAGSIHTLAKGAAITVTTSASRRYGAAEGVRLVDGLRGTLDHADGAWLGFEERDLRAVVDLRKQTNVRRIVCSFLENQGAWIFPPVVVDFETSLDGVTFSTAGHRETRRTSLDMTLRTVEIEAVIPASPAIRYVRVTAKGPGTCPAWHPGAGGKAWIFTDEIIVE
jgi:hexosaminidase